MSEKLRKDHWSEEEDKTLAELVLTFIREGKTQIKAFEEASNTLGRTKQACGFRWNKTLRKQYYIHQIDRSSIPGEETLSQETPNELAPNEVHLYLKQVMTSYDELAGAYEKLKVEYDQLHAQQEKIKKWISNGREILPI